jgi:putative membrane protein
LARSPNAEIYAMARSVAGAGIAEQGACDARGGDMPEPPSQLEVRLTPEAHFSWLRTRLSIERTLMSWVRTATALIGFGFSIVQFFERLSHMEGFKPPRHPDLPRHLGLALAVAILQYRGIVRYLDGGPFAAIAGRADSPWRTPAPFAASVLILVGVTAIVSVVSRAP